MCKNIYSNRSSKLTSNPLLSIFMYFMTFIKSFLLKSRQLQAIIITISFIRMKQYFISISISISIEIVFHSYECFVRNKTKFNLSKITRSQSKIYILHFVNVVTILLKKCHNDSFLSSARSGCYSTCMEVRGKLSGDNLL